MYYNLKYPRLRNRVKSAKNLMLFPIILIPPQLAALKVQTSNSNVRCVDSYICRTMASSELKDQLCKRTSVPTMFYNKGTKRWYLRLQHTRPKTRPVTCTSKAFKSREEAEAAVGWWRLSWEKGHKGKPIDETELHASQEGSISGLAPADDALRGKLGIFEVCIETSLMCIFSPGPPSPLNT